MRLSKIKLAGFKSFVDSTTLDLPSNLTGIVGPNGCGKSNTIDAVRWVMGESSAKHLRGASMEDVIFSGSSSRKPVGQASVELVFDNTDGKLGGQYAGYSEIAVRRQVTRDGTSQYFLNGTKCRRRDITDIFLGTGLGPRSYAIIEQGMISRLIEAKPEDMRVYLEEAAGISKYKERRRETENRIRHTRDNLDRLNDLREEVDKQLGHLQRQSRSAERYKTYKIDEKKLRAELLGLRWLEYQGALDSFEVRLQERQVGVDEAIERHEEADANLEAMREQRGALDRTLNDVQGQFYALGADITRTEQSIGHARSQRDKRENELSRITTELEETDANIEADVQRIAEIDTALAEAGPTREKVETELQQATVRHQQAEEEFQLALTSWEELTATTSQKEKTAQLESARAEQLQKNLTDLRQRTEKMQSEQRDLEGRGLADTLKTLAASHLAKSKEESELHGQLETATVSLTEARERAVATSRNLDQQRTELQNTSGRVASLEALQQAALGGSEKSRQEWLEKHNLADAPALARLLDIDAGWEQAIEVVLGNFLEAVCVDDFDSMSQKMFDVPSSGIQAVKNKANSDGEQDDKWLAAMVSCSAGIGELLHGVTTCESVEEAFKARASLQPGESIVTRGGIWMGRHWLCVRPSDDSGGVLVRQEELDSLGARVVVLEQSIAELESAEQSQKKAVAECEIQRDKCQALINARHREISSISGRMESTRSQLSQVAKRTKTVAAELEDLSAQIARATREQGEAQKVGGDADVQLQALRAQLNDAEVKRSEVAARRNQARAHLETVRDNGQATIVKLESMKSGRESTEQNMQRMKRQQQQLFSRRDELLSEDQPESDEIEVLSEQLETLIDRRTEVESQLQEARRTLELHDRQMREVDHTRNLLQQEVTEARELVQQVNMESQESRVRLKTIDEQLVEAGVDREQLLPSIPEQATVAVWAEQLEDIERKIQRLGPINLAAIEEYQEQLQRKEYLDTQYTDITEALETLEEAIHKIDRETRTMFRETFDIVNNKLQELFPRLFGGGQAMLELTGEDLLDAGVAVMARPPGKRVSSIQLLSGGEKAMTAVALVFAFFHLRPSPFCMLDEVDAPLDDANVGRFAKLVSEMSSQVQFIFITHNKVTMELSTQLMGVTMQEPGVSRLVSVDVDEAVELAVA
ncbi:chromosome segregation protein SMC [Chromatiales bacterium (ex Bugula neritina AB1)]|nr:chromosome segregation protein SMC [Chromatiales bacterium (ex Bugula neritina AB1)]